MSSYLEKLKTLEKLYKLESLGVEYISTKDGKTLKEAQSTSKQGASLKSLDSKAMQEETTNQASISLRDKILNCKLCERSNSFKPCPSLNLEGSNIESSFAFIAPTLSLEKDGSLSDTKINLTLKNIAQNIYKLDPSKTCFLSLVKCGTTQPLESNIKTCKPYLESELENKKYAIFFGSLLAKSLFGLELKDALGKILEYKNAKCIVTFDLLDMLKNPSLKKDALSHLNLLKVVAN
ncbi:uracil-DNA glycosylase family protein [Helicobacter sp. 11S02629-2]|uniref:uracil-DNA glycosylase family protein n=1 Tax=Helicobacter sp. 11S02629-2 TaxID=1476195 RepID=UPI000BA761DD|nr:uracil-DNA glycosylase family protein [Helicobacter sp. 11S02629-2]PAF45940.1 hypothetical protein BKH40_00575 [Helicobacter sp. 11S02629-2]